jgi:hypothetical protein
MKRRRFRVFGGWLCALAAFAVAFMPLAGVAHSFANHYPEYCVHASVERFPSVSVSLSGALERISDSGHPCRAKDEKHERHDGSTCSTCQVLFQFATSVISVSAIASIPEPLPIDTHGKSTWLFAAHTSYVIPFSRAPPAV